MNQNAISVIDDHASAGLVPMGQASVNSMILLASQLIDKKIATAKQWPRSISRFKREAGDLLSVDIETAKSAEYAKPVGGKPVRGPSVRLAELAMMCWGNAEVTYAGEPIINDKSVTVIATAYDYERNVSVQGIASAAILYSNGGRYPQHMIETTTLATASKAKRNAILNMIPRAYITDLLEVAKGIASQNQDPLEVRRQKAMDFLARSYKITEESVFKMLGVVGADDIGEDQLDELRLAINAIKEGEAKPEEFFPSETVTKADKVKEKIAERKAKAEQPATTPTSMFGGGEIDTTATKK